MEYKVKVLASDMTVQKSMKFGLDECLTALHESISDLTNEEFHKFPGDCDLNAVVHAMHCLQQVDDFNANLRELQGADSLRLLPDHEVRFSLWGTPREDWPKAGDPFPGVGEVLGWLNKIHEDVMKNMNSIDDAEFINRPVDSWPRLCDIFFRATYHINSHIREIWMLRGLQGTTKRWPTQHYA